MEKRIVSGVGGQHDFVVQAHELDDARAIIVLNSVRDSGGEPSSNIYWTYPHTTIEASGASPSMTALHTPTNSSTRP